MTIIVIAIVVALAAIVFGIFFIPGVGSALATGFGLAFFRVLGENRQKRIEARRGRWRRDNPAPTVTPKEEPEGVPADTPAESPRRIRLRRWRFRSE
jgi:hypothetical protein